MPKTKILVRNSKVSLEKVTIVVDKLDETFFLLPETSRVWR